MWKVIYFINDNVKATKAWYLTNLLEYFTTDFSENVYFKNIGTIN